MTETIHAKSINDLKPNDIVKSCKWLETGLCFQTFGLLCCVHGSTASPCIVTTEEINSGKVTYDLIIQRKRELFEGINGFRDMELGGCKDCCNIEEKQYKDVCMDYIGGKPLPSQFNIQNYTQCNQRCSYCIYAQRDDFVPPQYDFLKILDLFKEKGKLLSGGHIDFSGGEPAMLKNFDKILNYFEENKLNDIALYSNATIFSQKFCDLIKNNTVSLTTSLDTGIKSHYAKIRGADAFEKVIDHLIKYRNSGTNNLFLKYVITDDNRTDDDMWSFILAMLALRPNLVMICPDFPVGDKIITDETVKFAAKLWYNIEKYLGNVAFDYTWSMGDKKFEKYHEQLRLEINLLKEKNPIKESDRLLPYTYPQNGCTENNCELNIINTSDNKIVQNDIIQNIKVNINIQGCDNIVKLGKILGLGKEVSQLNIYINANNSTIDIGNIKIEKDLSIQLGRKNSCPSDSVNIKIGKLCSFGSAKIEACHNNSELIIEDYCMIGDDVYVANTDNHPIYTHNTKEILNRAKSLRIGMHSWIGHRVSILKNVHLMDNTMIGIGSVVTKSFDENRCFIAGNPAKIVKRNVDWSKDIEEYL